MQIKKGIIGNEKEEGGEGTALFNTSLDRNPNISRTTKKRGDANITQAPSNKKTKPLRKASVVKEGENSTVIDGVESFSSI